MNTKLLILSLLTVTIITLSIPSLAEMLTRTLHASSRQVLSEQERQNQAAIDSVSSHTVEIIRVSGKAYSCGASLVELTEPGTIPSGFFKTDPGGILEIGLCDDARVIFYPETELRICKIEKTGTIDLTIFNGEAEFITSSRSGRKIRVIADNVCINPESSHFRIILTPETCSGKVVVRQGMLRVTSEADPGRYFSLSTMFCLHFCDGLPQIPHRSTQKYSWKLNR